MEKQINKIWIYLTFIFGFVAIILFSTLIHQSCPPEKQCPTLDCNQCPIKTETKTVNNTIIKYQCYDNSIKDNINECSTLEQRLSSNISLSGSGNQVTDKFYLKQGLAIFKNSYRGLAVWLICQSLRMLNSRKKECAIHARKIGCHIFAPFESHSVIWPDQSQ